MITADVPFGVADLTSCDREAIHIPGSIQPHGVLLVVDRRDFNIRQSAGDSEFLLGVAARRMSQLSLYNLFEEQVLAPITGQLRGSTQAVLPYVLFGLTPRSGPFPLDATIHAADGEFGIIELEPARRGAISGRDPLAQIELMVSSLQLARDLNELCSIAATQLRAANGFDRVMVYEFLEDDSGVVIAEDKAPGVDTFLGLRYPASDIPQQARELYRRNWLRLIPDINYVPAALEPATPLNGVALDMSLCCLRSVSPIHLEYLRNMGVAASMSVSILLKGRLWGLFACHNYSPRFLALDIRVASKLFAQIFSLHLEAKIQARKSFRRLQAGHIQEEIAVRLTRSESIGAELVADESRLLSLIPAGGVAVLMDGKLHTAGITPPADLITEVLAWLKGLAKPIVSSYQLGLDFPPAARCSATASGLLAVALSRSPADYVIWFRPELVSTVSWAGNPEKAVTLGPLGDRLTPRKSFEAWQQEVRLQSEHWDEADLETARAFRGWLMEAVLYHVDLARGEREAATARQNQLVTDLELALVDARVVSEAKAAELAAQEASRSKSEFLASMSHEIRTPMNGIIGLTHSLRRLVSDPVQSDKLEKIDLTANHLLGIIDNILDISKIEAGKLIIDSDALSLRSLLDGVVFQLSPQAECKGLTLDVDIAAAIPDHLQGDSLRISQCLINYISNAIKFTEAGTVTVRALLQKWDERGVLLRFEVEDAGIGIEAEAIPRLFSAFEQADKTTTRRFGGTGLGLALTSQLASLMGGGVGVDSVPMRGSRFWFSALLQPAAENSGINRRLGDGPCRPLLEFKNARLLVAEDVALNREVLQDMLDEAHLTVDMAENGKVAVRMAGEQPYDLVLMDMQMPVMDGITATKAIRALPGYAGTPIIALTANAFNDDRERCLAAGMDDFISKPVRPALLQVVLAKWLEKGSQRRPPAPPPHSPPDSAIAPGDDAGKLRRFLAGITDIDITMDPSAWTKPGRYIRYLTSYAETFTDCMGELRAHLATGDREEARRLTHSLRGASGQIGVTGIQTLAAGLEEAIRSGADDATILPLAEAIEAKLAAVCADIRALAD